MQHGFDRLAQLSAANDIPLYFGQVKYKTKAELKKLTRDPKFISPLTDLNLGSKHLKTLLVKRHSYNYEKEVRLFAITKKDCVDKKNDDLVRLKVEPRKLFSSIRFDPAMDYHDYISHKNDLMKNFGFRNAQISRSTLMMENKLKIDL